MAFIGLPDRDLVASCLAISPVILFWSNFHRLTVATATLFREPTRETGINKCMAEMPGLFLTAVTAPVMACHRTAEQTVNRHYSARNVTTPVLRVIQAIFRQRQWTARHFLDYFLGVQLAASIGGLLIHLGVMALTEHIKCCALRRRSSSWKLL